jgi:hypothetical protein
MKLELLEGKSSDEIGDIWRTFYSGKDALSAVIPGDTYRQMATSLRQFSTASLFNKCAGMLLINSQLVHFYSI